MSRVNKVPKHVRATLGFTSVLVIIDFILHFYSIAMARDARTDADGMKKVVGIQATLALFTAVCITLVLIETIYFKTGNHFALIMEFKFMLIVHLVYLALSATVLFRMVLYSSNNEIEMTDGLGQTFLHPSGGYWKWERKGFSLLFGAQKTCFIIHFWLVKTAIGVAFRDEKLYLHTGH